MTDNDKALVERLRWSDGWFFENPWDHVVYASDDPLEAADRIEAQAAEIERLREALGWFLNDSRFVVQVGGNPNVVPQMIEAARAALEETLHVPETCKENGETFT